MTPNILMTRIDNRLVHGQVGVTWANTLAANLVIVANDDVATDDVQQQLMKMVLPDTIGIRFFTIERTSQIIDKAAPHQKIFIVVKTPQDVLRLLENGVQLEQVNIGNMHYKEGKKQVAPTVSVDDADIEVFKKIKEFNVDLFVQGIPGEKKQDIFNLI
ncbi:PTS galactosamine transporter subunit IIB [Breznakia pachnodae]|uniref:PTS system N-acetylgalactosamine-specific IIB component n=1 Tax=Breznakia pachnodae TaxID=265178 RepID=A0ABU0E011_9FIRM|nr:PTS galactosamine transporter subunit IIB [Breznakia pachnodae]MDQ0360161.1 PTS system N-acetylgalactosamine-specific IIB component [Breznakia pachnodae]